MDLRKSVKNKHVYELAGLNYHNYIDNQPQAKETDDTIYFDTNIVLDSLKKETLKVESLQDPLSAYEHDMQLFFNLIKAMIDNASKAIAVKTDQK